MVRQKREGLDFFSELKRREVYRAGAAYLATAFAVLEGASLVFPTLGVGPGVFNFLVVASVLGFPLTLILAWIFDVTGEGIQRTTPVDSELTAPAEDRWARAKAVLVGAGFVGVVWIGVGLWQSPEPEAAGGVPTDVPVLAVLPFDDFSPGGDQEYLADGLHEEVLHQLSLLRGIRLISRTSVAHFRGSPATLGAIADSLGARYVLEGSVRRARDSVQLVVQLIDAPADRHVWSESYSVELSLEALFEVQRELATNVARSLGGTLAAGTGSTLGRAPTANLDAYHAYLRGLHHWNQFKSGSLQAAVDDLEDAVTLDPTFGRAHGRLAVIYAVLNNFGGGTQGRLFPEIREHAELAMRHAPNDPASHLAMMGIHWPMEWDWEAVRQDLDAALDLDPNLVDAQWALAEWHGVIAGETDRGLEMLREADRLDPLSVNLRVMRAWILTNGQRYAQAAEVYRELASLTGDSEYTLNLASNLALAGRTEEALDHVRRVVARAPEPRPVRLAVHLARAGDTTAARAVLDEALARRAAGGSVAASNIAAAWAALGEIDHALTWLERSFEEEGGVYYLRSPDWMNLWSHPRFRDLWDRVGLLGDPPRRPDSASAL